MTEAYKVDERVSKDIVKKNYKCPQDNTEMTLLQKSEEIEPPDVK